MAGKSRNRNNLTGDGADARWTVRGVSQVGRKLATEYAKKIGLQTGDFVEEAIIEKVKRIKKGITDEGSTPVKSAPAVKDDFVSEFEKRLKAIEKVVVRDKFGPEDSLFADEAAEYLRISRQTLDRMRWRGIGPKWYRMASRVCYDVKDLQEWKDGLKSS